MSRIVGWFSVYRRLYIIIGFIVGVVITTAIWIVIDNLTYQPDGLFARPEPFIVAAAGDWGCGYNAERTVANIESRDPDVILALGDLSYEGSSVGSVCPDTDSWFRMMRPIDKNLYMVVGNHDLDKPSVPGLLKKYLTHFGLCPVTKFELCRDTYYPFNSHRVHFLILDSESPFNKGSRQYLSAERNLRIASSDPDTDWIIVAYHTARYASGYYCYLSCFFDNSYKEKTKEFLDIYHPLFDKYRVDLVLQGHVHNYQRTYPLKFDSDTKPPIRTSIANNTYKNLNGEIYLTVGTGGVGLEGVKPTKHNFVSTVRGLTAPVDSYYVVKTEDKHYGFLELEFSSDGSSLLGTFYANDAEKDSIALDHFTISKNILSNVKSKVTIKR